MKLKILVGSGLLVVAVLCYAITAKPLSYQPEAEVFAILQKNSFAATANGLLGSYYVFRSEQSADRKKGFIFSLLVLLVAITHSSGGMATGNCSAAISLPELPGLSSSRLLFKIQLILWSDYE